MSLSVFLLWLVSIPLYIHAFPGPRGYYINCGSTEETNDGSMKWITDEGFINVGNKTSVDTPGLIPILSSVRFFPDESSRKYCYVFPVTRGGKYLVRTTYFYGGFDGGKEPPIFDQIIQGTKWSTVNTTENYSKGLTSYYEITVGATGKKLSVCLARNEHTVSNPFISALELEFLESSMYNSTDFEAYALSTVGRHSFGYNGKIVSFPDDPFNRYWEPFIDDNPVVSSHSNISSSDFWNLPPPVSFGSALTTSRGKSLQLHWPRVTLPSTNYYMALYFQDSRTPSPYSWRVFNVSVNGKDFYTNLNVSTTGVVVYATHWPLSGQTTITLTPQAGSPVGPIINAGEIYQIVPLGGRTLTRDVIAIEEIARSFNDPPSDWSGDPCRPRQNSWTGITCSEDKLARIVTLNLTGAGLSGSLSPAIANLTALANIWLGGNKLTGPIPNMSQLKQLVSIHLDNNQFEGQIPESLGHLPNLRELFLQNNNLEDRLPDSLKGRSGINIQISPGNQIVQ